MFHFVANLKPYTLPDPPDDDRFDAYLLSADYTSGLADLAGVVRAEERVLLADNGNMDSLRNLAKEFAAEAADLDTARKAWEQARGGYARPQELPAELSSRFRALAEKLAARSEALTTDAFTRDAVRRQTSINPNMLVGMEDFTLATMGGLNLEPEYADLPESFFAARIRRAVAFAQRTTDGEFGEVSGQVLAGLHALDYDSGALAGQIAAEAGINGVTVGMFGALTDRNYVDYRVEDGKLIELAATVPRPYLRVVELAAGVLEGFRRAGRPRPAFHALGVGTPILLPLLSLLGQGERYFATDSTAPIVDGWSSPTISLYVTDPAPLKYKAYRIADVWIRGGRGWDCECQHCARFHEAHPPELGRAQKWWRAQGKPDIKKEMLERQGALSAWLPFLGYCADDDLRTEAGLARVGHNHWALRQLELEIRRRSERWPDLVAWVEGIVGAYQQAPGSAAWKAAVAEAFTLARAVGERLWQPGSLDKEVDVELKQDQQREHHEQSDWDRFPHEPDQGVPMQTRGSLVGHGRTLAKPEEVSNPCDASATSTPGELAPARVYTEQHGAYRYDDRDQPDWDRAPHQPKPRLAGQFPAGVVVVGHGRNLPASQTVGNLLGGGRGHGYVQQMPLDSLIGHSGLAGQQPSRALLRRILEELGKIEGLPRAWEPLQPLATDLAGLAAMTLDLLRANTTAVSAELEHWAANVDAWRQVLTEAAVADSEDALAWREALLAAITETVGAAEAQARVDALLQGDAPLLRAAEIKRRAETIAQSPFVSAYAAATAASLRLSSLAAYFAAAEVKADQQDSSPLATEAFEWLKTFTEDAELFVNGGFSQLHELFASDQVSVELARTLARSIVDVATGRGRLIGEVLGGVSRQGVEPGSLVEIGPVVLRLAEVGARLNLIAAYAAHIQADSSSLAAESWLASEREAAQNSFGSKVPTGVHAAIEQVAGLEDDLLVEVQGRIESLLIETDPSPPKFSTFVTLRAFDGGASVRLRAHMFSLEKNGLVEASLCTIRGFVRRQQPWLDKDEVGLDIDRVSLSKLRKQSWLDDVAYRMRPFFRLYHDEMNLYHTPGGV